MPSKSHKSDYAILIALGLLVGICLLGMYVWGAAGADSNLPGVRTTHSTNIDGTMVAGILFERFGNPLPASEHPLLADTLREVNVLWIIDPLIPLNAAEVAAVEEWVNGGGVLVSTGIPGRLFRGPLADGDLLYGGCVSCRPRAGRSSNTARSPSSMSVSSIPASARALALAQGVSQLEWASVRTLDIRKNGPFRPLLRDDAGVRVAERSFGQGSAILLADSSFLANGMVGKRDNAVLAVNLAHYAVSRGSGRNILYDEYHLGYGQYESGLDALSHVLFTTSPGWAVLSLTIAGLLYLLYKGRRFGTRREPGRPRRRSKLEFVRAVGASLRSAGAHSLAWKLVYGAWKRDASRELGLPVCVPVAELGARLVQRAGRANGYREFLQACEQASEQGGLSARKLATLLDELATLERETLNGHPGRRQNG